MWAYLSLEIWPEKVRYNFRPEGSAIFTKYRIRGQTFQFAGTAYVKSLILEPAEHADETGKSYVSGMHSTKMNSYASLRETREVRSLTTLSWQVLCLSMVWYQLKKKWYFPV